MKRQLLDVYVLVGKRHEEEIGHIETESDVDKYLAAKILLPVCFLPYREEDGERRRDRDEYVDEMPETEAGEDLAALFIAEDIVYYGVHGGSDRMNAEDGIGVDGINAVFLRLAVFEEISRDILKEGVGKDILLLLVPGGDIFEIASVFCSFPDLNENDESEEGGKVVAPT